MADHTPLPWRILYGHDDVLPIANRNGLILAHVEMPMMSTPAEWYGNAHAIVTSPEMLDFIERSLPYLLSWDMVQEGRALIAKAKGQTQ